MMRGFARHGGETIGNAWVDLATPQGVPQTLAGPVNASTLEGATQIIARGPVASQEAIKLLSGDGVGFFNAKIGASL
jgi:potassium-transporting ATPase potassium-binding subunit